jgi:hypothetical protein
VIFELDGAEGTAGPINIYAHFKLAVGVSPAGGLVDLSLRASNEIQMLLPSLRVVPLGRAPLVGPTAAVERAHSDRARSGSKGPTGVSFRPFMLGCRACRR